jgi:acetolactate synthase regulatory subunit
VESHRLTVVVRPAASALSRVVSVLHARRSDVSHLTYDGDAVIVIETGALDVERLAAQLRRLVDVVTVSVAPLAALAVAS